MNTKLISIGNSKGIRIPKAILEQAGLEDDIVMTVEDGGVVIRPAANSRASWGKAFKEMAEHEHEILLDEDTTPWRVDGDDEEWQW